MSKRVILLETPLSHSRLFQKVAFKDVRPGDIFQGKKDRKKWYKNTDVSQKDSKYTYWRRKSSPAKAVPKKPTPKKAHEPNKALLAAERRWDSAVNAYNAVMRQITKLNALLLKRGADVDRAYSAVKKARGSK